MEPSNDVRLPTITSWEDFKHICEVSSAKGNEDLKYKYTSFIFVEIHSGAMWYGSLPIRNREDISLEQAIACLTRVPDEHIYPHFLEKEFRVLSPLYYVDQDGAYYKGPKLLGYCNSPGGTHVGDSLLEEARMLEILDKYPHPNIVDYIGCVVKEGRLHAIAMKKYKMTLHTRCKPEVKDTMKKLDAKACLRDIAAGLDHLHGLGYAHNDINPYNIVVDDDDSCIIIDFGSCKKLGDRLGELGVEGFNEEFDCLSTVKNDEYGLRKVKEWLQAV